MMRITHIITGLNVGGAEMMLYKLLAHSDRKAGPVEVISLTGIGPVGERIERLGVPVRALRMNGISAPIALVRLALWLKRSKPDLIQTWMYHADVIGGLAALLSLRRIPVVWNIRLSTLSPESSKRRTIWLGRVSAFLSHWLPERIVCVSESARLIHEGIGYEKKKMVVIPNGFDTERFRPDSQARTSVREEIGIPSSAVLIGYVARFDPQKDHRTFIKAAQFLQASFPDVHFLLCGRRIAWENKQLASWIEEANLRERFHLLGERDDTFRITAALDIATLTAAFGEGFPNVVGEAMACGVPCVVTDVGDSAAIVGDTGITAAIGDAKSIAEGWARILRMEGQERGTLGQRARERIVKHYSIDSIVTRYYNLYEELCSN